ncbi:AI-2E family transporter [Methylomicrobium sp. Wu6]|uniref:AI-2E family transporter n=1 Tax=Methylomicrobium sp. Wu6 TaxID=3107928 RepID=UPI002DD69E60|nr:AI-2E family transporter [Methylomicrobium sp. Wu6]MEC4748131.1 AI-2E family transporter [Methylomicrobium sp. Wu6]
MNNELNALSDKTLEKLISHKMIDLFIRVGLIGFLVVRCYQIFKPFIGLILWSVILAVAMYPLHAMIARKMGGRDGRAATTLVLAILLSVLIPSTLLVFSFADSTTGLVKQVQNGTLQVPIPNESVAGWPVVGGKLYALWSAAHTDLGSVVAKYEPKIAIVTKQLLGYAASAGTSILMFLVALVLAGIWMAYGESGHAAAKAIAKRMAGDEKGETLVALSTATIRAVAQGVIGIACVQALLLGAGFILVGIPAAGIWALLVLLLGIMQIPAALVSLPSIIYVFYTNDSTPVAVMFAVYTMVAGSADNILKPLVLGRGVDAPMPVILLGALGGMATGGIIGLFLGSVLLALGYQLFMAWVYHENEEANSGEKAG